jgi:hypothetical protein
MADIALNCVINYLHDVLELSPNVLEVLGGAVLDDGNSPKGLNYLQEVLRDLRHINSLLTSFGMKQDEQIGELLSQIRDVAYEVEDIFDTALIVQPVKLPGSRKVILRHIQLNEVSKKIKDLRKEIEQFYFDPVRQDIARVEASADVWTEAYTNAGEKTRKMTWWASMMTQLYW